MIHVSPGIAMSEATQTTAFILALAYAHWSQIFLENIKKELTVTVVAVEPSQFGRFCTTFYGHLLA